MSAPPVELLLGLSKMKLALAGYHYELFSSGQGQCVQAEVGKQERRLVLGLGAEAVRLQTAWGLIVLWTEVVAVSGHWNDGF